MSSWVDVAKHGAISPGEMSVFSLDHVEVVVINLDDRYFAIEDVCTHDGSEISSGCLRGYSIECPRHGARFDIRSGEVLDPPAYEAVRVFQTRIYNGMIQVLDDSEE
ncbi:MAG: ferredoxin [Acidiferrobacteraceae bacterium]|nr:ferredoxin [Acidiferrobacteraceae bacterium]|tara:strand:+ start:3601 stop:3921 length:321 start_codon:yes stop_codon:yes gene_type:complete